MPSDEKPIASIKDRRREVRQVRETILVAEDSAIVRRVVTRLLQRAGFRVIVAESSDEALQAALAHDGALDLLLTDVAMPGMDVKTLERRVREKHPKIVALYMSGYDRAYVIDQNLLPPTASFIEKIDIQNSLVSVVDGLLKGDRT